MVITKTPLRISFVGGGTDLPDFYRKDYGAVVSCTIQKYVYIALHRYFFKQIVLKYSKTEIVNDVLEIQHPLMRECLLQCDFKDHVEIASFADIPSAGSGLGSSSAFCVGLIKALQAYKQKNISPQDCAARACEVEICRLDEPIGKQDQYASSYGGLNYYRFHSDESVHVEPIVLTQQQRRSLEGKLLLFYTGIQRSASEILSEQTRRLRTVPASIEILREMRSIADRVRGELCAGNLPVLADAMHEGWQLKRQLASGITSRAIDGYYDIAMKNGARGGKLLGAGGGGFLLFYCDEEKHAAVTDALQELRRVPFSLDSQGSRVLCFEEDETAKS